MLIANINFSINFLINLANTVAVFKNCSFNIEEKMLAYAVIRKDYYSL